MNETMKTFSEPILTIKNGVAVQKGSRDVPMSQAFQSDMSKRSKNKKGYSVIAPVGSAPSSRKRKPAEASDKSGGVKKKRKTDEKSSQPQESEPAPQPPNPANREKDQHMKARWANYSCDNKKPGASSAAASRLAAAAAPKLEHKAANKAADSENSSHNAGPASNAQQDKPARQPARVAEPAQPRPPAAASNSNGNSAPDDAALARALSQELNGEDSKARSSQQRQEQPEELEEGESEGDAADGAPVTDENGEPAYYVEKLLARRECEDGTWEYKVKWEGCPDSQNSWEPEENILSTDLIAKFEQGQTFTLKHRM